MCEYCETKEKWLMKDVHKVFGEDVDVDALVNDENEIVVYIKDIPILAGKINFCPMCGRKLNE